MNYDEVSSIRAEVYAALIFQAIGSAGTYIVAKKAMTELPPLVFGFYRFILAACLLLIIMIYRRRYFPFARSEWPLLILLAFLSIPINQGFFLLGLSLTPPTHPALLYATTPIWVYLLSVWRGEELYSNKKTLGIAIALIGIIAFFLEKGVRLATRDLLGDCLILIAVWAWASYTVLGRRLVQRRGAITVTASALILGTIIVFPPGLYLAARFEYRHITWVGWTGVLYTAMLTSVVLYTLWYWIIKYMEPSKAAVFTNLQPVITAILAYFIIGERLSAGSIFTGMIILIGVIITQMQ
jgi:drug/metabolite transporter (DMT)-like permease